MFNVYNPLSFIATQLHPPVATQPRLNLNFAQAQYRPHPDQAWLPNHTTQDPNMYIPDYNRGAPLSNIYSVPNAQGTVTPPTLVNPHHSTYLNQQLPKYYGA